MKTLTEALDVSSTKPLNRCTLHLLGFELQFCSHLHNITATSREAKTEVASFASTQTTAHIAPSRTPFAALQINIKIFSAWRI
jgi:hypothetical protein